MELTLSKGTVEIEQFFVLKTSDGKYVYVHAAGTGAGANDVRVVMDFEAPIAGSFAWLNSGKYVARRVLNATAKTMTSESMTSPAYPLRRTLQTSSGSANRRACRVSLGIFERRIRGKSRAPC